MKRICILLMMILSSLGCLTAQSYHVGDIYTAPDGSQGVVFYLFPDGTGGWAVALNDASESCAWGDASDVPDLANQNVSHYQMLLYDTSGYTNTQLIRNYQNSSAYAAGVVDFAHGWYLPSPAQLRMLHAIMPRLVNVLENANGTRMSLDWYWCSAEQNETAAWQVDFGHNSYHGHFNPADKSSLCHVRAVRTFSYGPSYLWSTGQTTASITVAPQESTVYTVTASSTVGYSDVDSAEVTVLPRHSVSFSESVCDSYNWGDETYTQSGEYTRMLTNVVGCDSVVTLYLTVNYTSDSTLDVVILENDLPYIFNGDTLTQPGTYTQTLTNAGGCDSIITLLLTVHYNVTTMMDSTVCENQLPIVWNGLTFEETATQNAVFTAQNGADSIVVMHLEVHPTPIAAISGLSTLCTDSVVVLTADSAAYYLWNTGATTRDITISEAGTYSLTVSNQYGCSSTATHLLQNQENPILSVTIPDMCAGGSYTVSVGHQGDDNIVLGHGETTLSMADTIYLPDGVYCDPYGCSYQSPLTFTAYADGDVIQSADDIYYVLLNMEHSWIGDIYINITCPNGQKADLLKYGGSGTSDCNAQIPFSSRGWKSGSNIQVSSYLGAAYDYDVPTCDEAAFGNEPGVGWNYCWSNNTTQGYTYAPGDGYIYRSGNASSGIVDSSNVAAGTQFYHPDDPFSNLIGCPLNGTWTIEVLDGWSGDNGYIFGWELALSTEMLPDVEFVLDHSTADGPWVTTLSDSLFQINPPADLAHDTTIAYTFTVYDTTGCGYDTTVNLTFFAAPHTEFDTAVCVSFTWNGVEYTTSGQYVQTFTSAQGCDSVVTCNLTIMEGVETADTLELVENQLPYYFAPTGTTYTMDSPAVSQQTCTLSTVQGCDSVVTLTVVIHPNITQSMDTAVCASALPLAWHGAVFGESGTQSITTPASTGADSTVVLTVAVFPTYFTSVDVGMCQGESYVFLGETLTEPGVYTDTLQTVHGCDSVVTLTLTVYPSYNIPVSHEMCQGESYDFFNETLTSSGTYMKTFQTANGCDSVITLTLTVHPLPTAEITGPATLCTDSSATLVAGPAASYLWSTGDTTQAIGVTAEGSYTVTVTGAHGCAATAAHQLQTLENPILSVTVPEMCAGGSYTLTVGHQSDDNVVLGHGETTLSMADTIYLPDGVYCEPYGCSYQSPLTFTAYGEGATIQSADDIYYVRLNMEHSWIGDIYINITCPNGQKADLLKYGGSGTSDCNSQIPASSRGWKSGSNTQVSSYLGAAYDYDVMVCDANAFGNEPGVGWNYCWSNNTTQGYTYAPGDGYIYRSGNVHNGVVDSSNVAAGTQFYHPDDPFGSLVGCPLNGTWTIEVLDGWSGDNGYIFGWELALSTEMLPDVEFVLDHSTADGPWVTTLSDSLFQINPPANLAHDTTIAYTFTVYDTAGCGYDTTVNITFLAVPHTEFDTAVCVSFTWNGVEYTTSGQYVQTFTNFQGCDSVVTCTLSLLEGTSTTGVLELVENQLPYYFAPTGTTFTVQSPAVSQQTYTLSTVDGCDSVVTQTVYIYHNVSTQVDTTVCASSLPYTWHGHTYAAAGYHSTTLLTSHGADSTVTYHLSVDNIGASIGNVTHITCHGESTGAATATVTGGQSPMSYSWTNASGTGVSTATSISNRPAGAYTFTVTDNLGCTATASVTLNTLNGPLTPGTIASDQDVCEGAAIETFTGTAASGGDNGAYQWQISADGADWAAAPGAANAQNYTYPSPAAGNFALRRAWVSQSCGTVYSNEVSVSVWQSTSDTVAADVCQGAGYQGDGFDIAAEQIAELGPYTFEQHYAGVHCDSAVVLQLTVHPNYAQTLEDEICEGDGYNNNGFHISPNETVGVGELERVLNLQSAAGCDSVVTLQLTVVDTAARIVSLTEDFCDGMMMELMVVTEMPDYEWSTLETSPNITVTMPGLYSVTAYQGDCSVTAWYVVQGCDLHLYLPNAITPTKNEGLNDYFSIPELLHSMLYDFEISIMNRWGEQIFYSTDKSFRWYGEYNGAVHVNTVYNYVIRYKDMNGKPFVVTGSITVL